LESRPFGVPKYLSVLPLFNDLSPAELSHLAEGCALRRVARSEMVFHMGEPCNEFHVIVTGQIKLFALSPGGQEKVVDLIGPGQSFGEAVMFADRPYILSAQALVDTFLLTVSKQAVIREIERDHRFALRMLAGLSRRMHGLVHDVQAYALHSGLQRVIGFLLRDQPLEDCSSAQVLTVSLPVSKATVASRLSLTPEYFSRVLRELETHGLIEVDKRDIRIPDPKKLSTCQLMAA
jgi:CRP/FNR family transcriptional regulator, dissimilatory nitrate respiration regulator